MARVRSIRGGKLLDSASSSASLADLMSTTTTHPTLAVNIKDESFFKELGTRIAQARKERNITQVQLAATLGIRAEIAAAHGAH